MAEGIEVRGRIVGTAGHVDHGKTALVRALTGVDTDRLREEKERGLTIDLGFAPLDLGAGLEVGVVDVPGHEDFLRNMLAGASGVDVLLLVVAADEGPMPQTREHLAIASLLGVRSGVVALTKMDRVVGDPEWTELAGESVREELGRAGIPAGWPIVPVSAVTGAGLPVLKEKLAAAARSVPSRDPDDVFRMPVDRCFSIRGVGTVVTGTIWSGSVRRGDELRIVPSGAVARVRGLQVHGGERESVGPARRCAVALAGLSVDDVPRGEMLAGPGAHGAARRLGVRLRLLPDARAPLGHADEIRVFLGTREGRARVLLPDTDALAPGGTGWAVLDFSRPVAARALDRFVLRSASSPRAVGGGEVAEPDPPRRWRERAATWAGLLDGSMDPVLAAVRLAGGRGLDPAGLPARTGRRAPAGEPGAGIVRLADRFYDAALPGKAADAIVSILRTSHAARPRLAWEPLESLRARVGRAYDAPLLDGALDALAAEGALERRGPDVRLAGHRPRLSEEEQRVAERLREALLDGGLAPPGPAGLTEVLSVERGLVQDLLRLAAADGKVVVLNPDLVLATEAERRLRREARAVLERTEPASPAAFAEALGLTRRQLIPLLEHLDRAGCTERTGEGRIRGPAWRQST